MSDPHDHRRDETPDGKPPPEGRSGFLSVVLVLVGVALLLPGACSLFFVYAGLVTPVAILGFLASLGGVFLMAYWLKDASPGERAAVIIAVVLFFAFLFGVVAIQFRH